jgi:hypothetical protein
LISTFNAALCSAAWASTAPTSTSEMTDAFRIGADSSANSTIVAHV